MKRARVAWQGGIHWAMEHGSGPVLADGRRVNPEEAVWLPPLAPTPRPRTIFALESNYAVHAKAIPSKPLREPLVFLKGENALLGHRAKTRRPDNAACMHYGCELAVVIGRSARRVARRDAYDYIAGYTVANDYAIRDRFEEDGLPNLRMKSRDGCTPLGPWLVDAADVPDPMNLRLQTTVNGKVTQEGTTRDMVFDIPFLVEYLSSLMTLSPGDLILTGTPEGLADVRAGDEVVTEIESVGNLANFIVGGSDALACAD